MDYDVIVVGGGVGGLTAAAYLSKAGYSTLLCEKEATCGGLVHTFERNGFVFDGGIRAMEDSGIVFPMLKHLGVKIDFVRNQVTLGVEDRIIRVDSEEQAVADYHALLAALYPESREEIARIIERIRTIMRYMDIQYGIKNPVFLDPREDWEYFAKAVLPWMFRYALTISKVNALKEPVVDYLRRFTQNQSLLDIITQHFFRGTPAFFALSYFSLYLDYHYPKGGTGTLARALEGFIRTHKGTILTDTQIVALDPVQKRVTDAGGNTHTYRILVWAADLKVLYATVDPDALDDNVREAVRQRREQVLANSGGDSVLTLYLALDLDKAYFAERASEHFFYTPRREGQSQAGPIPTGQPRAAIEAWLKRFLELTTYEISIPVLRDASLAPPGKTGLIVSVLFDYELTRQIDQQGWYEAFKALSETTMIDVLEASVFPGLEAAILDRFSSTPLTISRIAGTSEGAITGWAFTDQDNPAESRLLKVTNSVRTPIPGIFQAGQWTFSPSGFPTAILTGKLAADQVVKALKGTPTPKRQ